MLRDLREPLPLPAELQSFVEEEVKNGHFRTHDEVIWEALHLLRERRRGIR